MSEQRDLDRVADNAEDELRKALLRGRIAQDDGDGLRSASWILDRAERIKRQRRIQQIKKALVVVLVLIVVAFILIVGRW